MSLRRARALSLAALAAACFGLAACNPNLRTHGFRYVDGEVPEIIPGEDTEATILSRLGSPSTRGVFETNTWYYISSTNEELAYLRPDTRERLVLAVTFNADGVVETVDQLTLADGRRVAYVDRETPTRGRELTVLEQLLGNVGRLPGDQFGGEQNLPGGAGGPRPDGGP